MAIQIKVHNDVYRELTKLKRDEKETFSEVVSRLLDIYEIFEKVYEGHKKAKEFE